jgi:hypothetical protein
VAWSERRQGDLLAVLLAPYDDLGAFSWSDTTAKFGTSEFLIQLCGIQKEVVHVIFFRIYPNQA